MGSIRNSYVYVCHQCCNYSLPQRLSGFEYHTDDLEKLRITSTIFRTGPYSTLTEIPNITFSVDSQTLNWPYSHVLAPKAGEDCACDESTSGGLLDMTGRAGGRARGAGKGEQAEDGHQVASGVTSPLDTDPVRLFIFSSHSFSRNLFPPEFCAFSTHDRLPHFLLVPRPLPAQPFLETQFRVLQIPASSKWHLLRDELRSGVPTPP